MELLKDNYIESSSPFESLFERFEQKKEKTTWAPHERADLINQFLAEINKTVGKGYKPADWKKINGQLRHKDNSQLYIFFQECKRAKNFGAFFWFKLKNERAAKKSTLVR